MLFYCREYTRPRYVSLPDSSMTAKIVFVFYRRHRELNEFLASCTSISRGAYVRAMALGCLDALVTLPIVILNIVLAVLESMTPFVFYPGWSELHSNWTPLITPKSEWAPDFWGVFAIKWNEWISPFFALIFILLFGFTEEARSKYCSFFWFVVKPFGLEPRVRQTMSNVVFQSVNFNAATVDSS